MCSLEKSLEDLKELTRKADAKQADAGSPDLPPPVDLLFRRPSQLSFSSRTSIRSEITNESRGDEYRGDGSPGSRAPYLRHKHHLNLATWDDYKAEGQRMVQETKGMLAARKRDSKHRRVIPSVRGFGPRRLSEKSDGECSSSSLSGMVRKFSLRMSKERSN